MSRDAEPLTTPPSADARAWLEQRRDSLRLLQRMLARPPKSLLVEARTNDGTRRLLGWARLIATILLPLVVVLDLDVCERYEAPEGMP